MQTQSSSLTEAQQVLVLSCDSRVRRLAWKYARNAHDVEEMYALGMEEVCKVVSHTSLFDDPYGYLYRSVQHAMIDELKRKERMPTLSLDAPFSSQNDFCLADILPATPSVPASTEQTVSMDAVRRALARLSPREREVLLHRYGFDGSCGTLSNIYGEIAQALGITRSGAASIATVAHRKLRGDPELCKAVGVEPPPKPVPSPELLAQQTTAYSRELAAWNAGYQSVSSLGKALGVSRSTAHQRLVKMREIGLIPAINQRTQKGASL